MKMWIRNIMISLALVLLVLSGCTQPIAQKKLVPDETEQEGVIITATEQPAEPGKEVVEDIEVFDAEDMDLQEFDDWTQDFDGL